MNVYGHVTPAQVDSFICSNSQNKVPHNSASLQWRLNPTGIKVKFNYPRVLPG